MGVVGGRNNHGVNAGVLNKLTMRTVCFVDPQHFCGDAEPVGIKVGEGHKLGAVGVGAAQVPSEGPYTAAPNPDNSEAYLHHLRSTPRVTDVMGSLH